MTIREITLDIDTPTRLVTAGEGAALLLLHGGTPGVSPFWGGSHLWGEAVLNDLAKEFRVLAPDLAASGVTDDLDVATMVAHALAITRSIGSKVHLLGHDIGGLIGLHVAMHAPDLLSALTIVSSNAASPTGDGVENVTLLSPPEPKWSAHSQRWAYDRLSFSPYHIDDALIDASVAAAQRNRASFDQVPDKAVGMQTSILRAKAQFFKHAREKGIEVPVQIVWAANDPLVTLDHGLWLHKIIGDKQPVAQFHLINRVGSFPFREVPAEFCRLVTAFSPAANGAHATSGSA